MKPGPYLIWGLLGAAAIVVAAVYLGQSTGATAEALADRGRFRTSAILGGRNHSMTFDSFVGGDASALLGGVDLDFRGSTMSGDEAEIDLFVMMGGVELRIPQDWVVVNDLNLLLGGIEDKTQSPSGPDSKRLVLRGAVLMGGVNIRN